jgi:serine/threonine-protein kinase
VTSSDPYGLVGQVLDGQFRVDTPIGEGGFSVVYRGTHVGLSEPIAIKCLKLPVALGSALVESFVQRFRDESRIHYRLSQGSLHIARAIASGTTMAPATGALVPYTVLEWLDGHSLAHDFEQRRKAGMHGRSMREVVTLLDSAIDALAHAHAQGVVHRDLNPGNFFLARTPVGTRVKILDFGVAKILADSAIANGPVARTVGNIRMFAPAYGAPEQFDDRSGAIGPWTDVYTIGLVLLEALTDRTVMEGEHLGEFMLKAMDEKKRPTPRSLGISVGDETEKVFANALSVDPSRRPRDAGELWGTLKNAIHVDSRLKPAPTVRMEEAPSAPNTLRIKPRESSAPPQGSRRPLGGTLRIEPGGPKSASEWLAVTPLPFRASPTSVPSGASTPVPPRHSTPSILPGGQVRPSAVPPTVDERSTPGRPSYASQPVPWRPSAGPPSPPPEVDEPAAPPGRVWNPTLVVAMVIVVLAGAAGVGWHVWHSQPTDPASPDTVPSSP